MASARRQRAVASIGIAIQWNHFVVKPICCWQRESQGGSDKRENPGRRLSISWWRRPCACFQGFKHNFSKIRRTTSLFPKVPPMPTLCRTERVLPWDLLLCRLYPSSLVHPRLTCQRAWRLEHWSHIRPLEEFDGRKRSIHIKRARRSDTITQIQHKSIIELGKYPSYFAHDANTTITNC